MKNTNMVGQVLVCVYFKAFQIAYSLTISGSGNYIIPNTCYKLTCSYNTFKDDRQTVYNVADDKSNGIKSFTIRYLNFTGQCYYRNPDYVPCTNDVCSCDRDGMATHICYNHTSNITGNISINCFSGNNSVIRIPVAVGPGDSMGFIPPSPYHIKTSGKFLGPITCSASCYPACQYEWTMLSRTITRGSTFNILSLTKDDDGIYSCKAWNEVYTSGKSITFNLTINYGPASVSLSPPDTTYTVTEGNDIPAISCMADCKPPCVYTWSGLKVPAGTDNVLKLQNIHKNQKGVFNCAASNYVGILNSTDVNIDVQFGPGSSLQFEPSITAVTKKKGDTLGPINCAASCNPPCQYKWTKLDKTVNISTQLMLASLSIEDHGQFTCTATNGIGSSGNKSLDMIVNYGPMEVILLPATQQYTVEYGENIPAITCSASCRPDCKYMWSGPNGASFVLNLLSLPTIQKNQSGNYYCRASNEIGSMQSSIINVNVQFGPGSSLQFYPGNISVTKRKGDKLGPIECRATCNPTCQYKWTKPDKTILYDRELMIESLSIDDHGPFICTASNRLGDVNNKLDVTVNYGPVAVILSPSTKQYIVKYGHTLAPINCSANCRPECSHMWSGPNIPSGAVNILHLQHIQKNQSGDFQCRVSNEVGSLQSTFINVNVQYEPIVNRVTINGTNFTVSENTTVILYCNYEGNPATTLTWTKNNIILGEDDDNNGRSFYTLNRVRCKDTGNYSCVANNSLGMSSAQQSLFVTCFPRLNVFKQQPPKLTGLLIGETLNLTVHIIDYPKLLKVNWTFQSSSSSDDERSNNYTTSLKSDLFTHVAYFYKYHLKKDDFGNYTLEIQNAIGGTVVHYFVDRAGSPDPPTDLLVICETSPIVVLWKPGFNGGTPQWFTVTWKDMKTNTSMVSSSIPDSDNGQYVKFTTSSLSDGATYLIYVEASNKYGRVRTTMYDNCTTKSAEFFQSGNFIAVGVGAGIGTSLMILILAAIVVFIFKRLRRRAETEGNTIYESTQSGSRELPANEDHIYNDLQQFQGDNNKQHIDQATYANQSF